MKKSMLQRVPATSQNKSLLQIDAAVEEWQSAEAGKSFWFYRQLMNPRLLLTGYWFPRRIAEHMRQFYDDMLAWVSAH